LSILHCPFQWLSNNCCCCSGGYGYSACYDPCGANCCDPCGNYPGFYSQSMGGPCSGGYGDGGCGCSSGGPYPGGPYNYSPGVPTLGHPQPVPNPGDAPPPGGTPVTYLPAQVTPF
jgi:hypothetical protein